MSSHTVEEMERTTKVSPVIGGAVVALALAVALAGYAAAAGLSSRSDAATKPPDATQTTALRVVSSTPYRGARGVSPAAAIVVRFSTPLSADTPYPRLTPSVPGTWRKLSSTALVFRPAGHLPPLAAVSVTVPAGRTGMRGRTGSLLARSYVFSFTTGGGSVLRLQQLLADLGYLPLRFTTLTAALASDSASAGPRSSDLIPLAPQRGVFTWRYQALRDALAPLWKAGQFTVLVRGAVMTFESDHDLRSDGIVGPQVWSALLDATAHNDVDRHAYDYIQVSMANPETLSVWRAGRVVFQSPANTGIMAAPTALGTFPFYSRYLSTTMSGLNPDGTPYKDVGVRYVAYFNGGDAVHSFLRSRYGFPQSLGCVELPVAAAAVVFEYDQIGTLVGIS